MILYPEVVFCTLLRLILFLERESKMALVIRQSLGVSVAAYVKQYWSPNAVVALGRFSDEITSLLCLLLPNSDVNDLSKVVLEFTRMAVALKQAMTEEIAIYSCSWAKGGEQFDADMMEASGESENGDVSLCTFPGLTRLVLNDDSISQNSLVKASVVLSSVLSYG